MQSSYRQIIVTVVLLLLCLLPVHLAFGEDTAAIPTAEPAPDSPVVADSAASAPAGPVTEESTAKPGYPEKNFFSAGLRSGCFLPLGETAVLLNPALLLQADCSYNFAFKPGNLGVSLTAGIQITKSSGNSANLYVLQMIPVALKIKFSGKPDFLKIGIPLLFFLEAGGGVSLNMISFEDEQWNPPDSSFWFNMAPIALWDFGLGCYITPRLSLCLSNTGMLIFFNDLVSFSYTPHLQVEFYF